MKIRAVICDVYKTLLDVAPNPQDAGERWTALCGEMLAGRISSGLGEFNEQCQTIIAREHAIAEAAGIEHPEIFWPAVAVEALPNLRALSDARLDDFLFRHAGLCHGVGLMNGAADALRDLSRRGILLGIASNAQPYTLRELDLALEGTGLSRSLFLPELTFWSFEHGFSKPNPHVIRLLTARLCHLGIAPRETLMVGDRLDNDIEPARVQGWHAWRIAPVSTEARTGDWPSMVRSLGY